MTNRGRSAALAIAAACLAMAQSPPHPKFDVASVKVADGMGISGVHGGPGSADPGRYSAGRADLIFYLTQAYGVQRDQIIGPDAHMNADGRGYSIEATMSPTTSKEQFQLMFQDLLVERFHLVLRHETRPFPGYELTVAPGGTKLKDAGPGDAFPADDVARLYRTTETKSDAKGFPVLRPGMPWLFTKPHIGTPGTIRGSFHVSMTKFLEYMPYMILESLQVSPGSSPTPRIVDRTGLKGVYNFTLEYVGGIPFPAGSRNAPTGVPAEPIGGSGGGPILFTALEKQVGLTLKKTKDVPVEMIVVDHADKIPTGN